MLDKETLDLLADLSRVVQILEYVLHFGAV